MSNSFDSAAENYDRAFTHSVIGRLQRGFVHRHLSEILKTTQPRRILEINCGTGEDAIWLAKQNFDVTATDISETMVEVAKRKGNFENLAFRQADINDLFACFSDEKFELIFSNFGGLNCLSEIQMELFFKNAGKLLSKNGILALVIMPKDTLWERFYFLAKANFKNVYRRKKGSLIANVEGEKVITYYYNPSETIKLADYYFKFLSVNPIGFFVPPSYLEPFFRNRPGLISILQSLESKVQHRESLSKYSDHYLIAFRKR